MLGGASVVHGVAPAHTAVPNSVFLDWTAAVADGETRATPLGELDIGPPVHVGEEHSLLAGTHQSAASNSLSEHEMQNERFAGVLQPSMAGRASEPLERADELRQQQQLGMLGISSIVPEEDAI